MMINYGIIVMHRLYKKYHKANFFIHNEIYCYEGCTYNRTYALTQESKKFLKSKRYIDSEYEKNAKEIVMLEANIIRLEERGIL